MNSTIGGKGGELPRGQLDPIQYPQWQIRFSMVRANTEEAEVAEVAEVAEMAEVAEVAEVVRPDVVGRHWIRRPSLEEQRQPQQRQPRQRQPRQSQRQTQGQSWQTRSICETVMCLAQDI